MNYEFLCEEMQKLESSPKRLEKIEIVSEIIKNSQDLESTLLLLQGRIFPEWSDKKLGLSSKLAIKAIASAYGIKNSDIEKLFSEKGDLGIVAQEFSKTKKQQTLFSISEKLTVEKVFNNLKDIAEIEGNKSQDMKIAKITEILSIAKPLEAKFIIRTLIGDLRIGVSSGTIRDGIQKGIFPEIIGLQNKNLQQNFEKTLELNNLKEIFEHNLLNYNYIKFSNYEMARQAHNKISEIIQQAYDKINEMAKVASIAKEKGLNGLKQVDLQPGIPFRAMLMQKVNSVEEAKEKFNFPFIMEYKYDGFRCQIHKKNNEIFLFTRNLENVSNQFPDIIQEIEKIKHNNFIIDGEILGIDKDGKFLSFQNISQRIKRKHNIHELVKKIPVVLATWDVMYFNESKINLPLLERRKILEKIIINSKNIFLSKQKIIEDLNSGKKFYEESLKEKNEGVVVKDMNSTYKPGNRVGCWLKLKPIMDPLDLVIVKAQRGEGKRSKWITSYYVACRDPEEDNVFYEIGKVSSGLKEELNENDDLSYQEMTSLIEPLIDKSVPEKDKTFKLKSSIVITVAYEEIQKSTKYSSGFALRFPRILGIRKDLDVHEADDLNKVKDYFNSQ